MIALFALVVFASHAALDYALVRHQLAAADRRGWRAGWWSMTAYGASVAGTVAVVEVSCWLAIAGAAGLLVGNLLAARR